MDSVLTYDQVEICYNGIPAVQDISFSLAKGEILGIVGESGSGKSTLIKAPMGLLGPAGMVTKGDIWFKGMDLPDISPVEQRQVNGEELSMIFQQAGSSFCPIRTVGAQLFECMREHRDVKENEFLERAEELFRRIGFTEPSRILKSYPFELSGGMQQRVGIAAAMLQDPSVLLADEPTSALDVSVQKQVVEELLLIRETFGTSMILVTHNIGVVGAIADRVLIMKDGRMVEYGDTRQVLENPSEEYSRKLMAAVPRLRRS